MELQFEQDAKEFGVFVKQGGWRLGLLVARNVEKGTAGRPSKIVAIETNKKVTAREFALESGVGKDKVLRYLEAWNRAAEDIEELPTSSELAPGSELDLSEEWIESHPWNKYYTTVNKKPGSNPEGDALEPARQEREFEHAVKSNPEFARKAAETLRTYAPETSQVTPEQVREAVRTNREVEEAAREESFNRLRERVREQSPMKDPTVPAPEDRPQERTTTEETGDLLKFAAEMKKAERAMRDALYLANQIEQPIDEAHGFTTNIRELADQIEIALATGGVDIELAALLNGES